MQFPSKQISAVFVALSTLATSATAQQCYSAQDIDHNDFLALITTVRNNNFNPRLDDPFSLKHKSSRSFYDGTAEFCIQNKYIFENTHVSLSTIADAAQRVFDNCGESQGGTSIIQGDSGLNLTFTVFRIDTQGC